VSDGYHFATTHGTHTEKTRSKEPIKCKNSVVQRYVSSFAQQQARQTDEPPQGAGNPHKPRDIEHLTKVENKWVNGYKISKLTCTTARL
jgi:hypothetical protein